MAVLVPMPRSVRRGRTFGIDLASQLQGVRVGEIGIGGRDGEDDGRLMRNVGTDHGTDLLLDVLGLLADGHL